MYHLIVTVPFLAQSWLFNRQFPLLPLRWQVVFYHPTTCPMLSATFSFSLPRLWSISTWFQPLPLIVAMRYIFRNSFCQVASILFSVDCIFPIFDHHFFIPAHTCTQLHTPPYAHTPENTCTHLHTLGHTCTYGHTCTHLHTETPAHKCMVVSTTPARCVPMPKPAGLLPWDSGLGGCEPLVPALAMVTCRTHIRSHLCFGHCQAVFSNGAGRGVPRIGGPEGSSPQGRNKWFWCVTHVPALTGKYPVAMTLSSNVVCTTKLVLRVCSRGSNYSPTTCDSIAETQVNWRPLRPLRAGTAKASAWYCALHKDNPCGDATLAAPSLLPSLEASLWPQSPFFSPLFKMNYSCQRKLSTDPVSQ
uniref:Uncharacterized protein n=1 Tax=Eutreptiella gymnastica TaxID=73025 RepID=A0A7S4FUJ3_9EUGL